MCEVAVETGGRPIRERQEGVRDERGRRRFIVEAKRGGEVRWRGFPGEASKLMSWHLCDAGHATRMRES